LEIGSGKPSPELICQGVHQIFKQGFAVFSAIRALLFVFDNTSSDLEAGEYLDQFPDISYQCFHFPFSPAKSSCIS
jgi:hypothetical protein